MRKGDDIANIGDKRFHNKCNVLLAHYSVSVEERAGASKV